MAATTPPTLEEQINAAFNAALRPPTPRPSTATSDPGKLSLGQRIAIGGAMEQRMAAGREAQGAIPATIDGLKHLAKDIAIMAAYTPSLVEASIKDVPHAVGPGGMRPPGTPRPATEALIAEMGPEKAMAMVRGQALVIGAAGGVAAGRAVSAVGAQLMRNEALSSSIVETAIATGTGFTEGATFGGTYGALTQLTEDGVINSDHLAAQILGFGIFGGLINLTGRLWGVGARQAKYQETLPGIEEEILEGLAIATREPTEVILREGLPIPEVAWAPAEAVAQTAAGIAEQGPLRQGLMGRINSAGRTVLNIMQTRFPKVKGLDPTTWGLGLSFADSRTFSAYLAQRSTEAIESGLTAEQASIFWRGLMESRFRQIKRGLLFEAQRLERAGPGTFLEARMGRLSADELKAMAENVPGSTLTSGERIIFESLPEMKHAMRKYGEEVLPILTQMRVRNGLTSLVETDLPFVPLVRATPEMIEQGIAHVPGFTGDVIAGERTLGRATAQKTPGARRAFGQADAYVADGRSILNDVFSRDAAIDRKNALIANIIEAPWTQKAIKGVPTPKTVKVAGVEYPVDLITVTGSPEVIRGRLSLATPETIQDAAMLAAAREQAFIQGVTPPRIGSAAGPPRLPRGKPQEVVKRPGTALRRGVAQRGEGKVPVGEEIPEAAWWDTVESGFGFLEGLEGVGSIPGEVGENILGKYWVPRPVAQMWEELTIKPSKRKMRLTAAEFDEPAFRAYARFMDFNTGLLLASPVEMAVHFMRMSSRLASMPTLLPESAPVWQKMLDMVPWVGQRANAWREIFSVYGSAEDAAFEQFLSTIPGALPSRAFEGEFQGGVHAVLRRAGSLGGKRGAELGEAAASTLETGRKFLFNLPTRQPLTARAIARGEIPLAKVGADIRTRIVGAKGLRRLTQQKLKRDPTKAEYAEFLQQWGTYTEELQSTLMTQLRANRLNPFAANLSVLTSEVRGFLGGTNLPRTVKDELTAYAAFQYQAEVMYRMTVGTALFMWGAQKALTGTDIWNNEPGHKFDLRIPYETEDGRYIYAPMSTFEPDVSRAGRIVGARAVLESVGNEVPTSKTDFLRDIGNQAITIAIGAPGLGAAQELVFGGALFITDEGKFLQITPPEPTELLTIKQRFLHAAATSNPTVEAILGYGASEHVGEGTTGKLLTFANAVTGGFEVGREPLLRESANLREDESQISSVVFNKVLEAISNPDLSARDRVDHYREVSEQFPESFRLQALREMIQLDMNLRRGAPRKAAEARLRERRR